MSDHIAFLSAGNKFNPGMRVFTKLDHSIGDWDEDAIRRRKDGIAGTVLRHYDSHGLCHDVLHFDGTEGSYEPHELKMVDDEQMISALQAIARLGGNLPDEAWNQKGGPNDARMRGELLCQARGMARWALGLTFEESVG